jgi:simple sugar transport system ATP-binding protein
MQHATPLFEVRNLVKSYGHVHALVGASLSASEGEIVALVGDNGAGKTTLVKCCCGVEAPDSGDILLDGVRVDLATPANAQRLGIETVYQDLALALDLDAAANLYLGREVYRKGLLGRLQVLDNRRMRVDAIENLSRLGVQLKDVAAPVRSLSGGQRQVVAVARAIAWATRVLFLDEPTAALGVVQREHVLDVMRAIRDQGLAVVLISHNMPEVLSIADRIEVLRLGRRVARFEAKGATLDELVAAMTGALTHEEAA